MNYNQYSPWNEIVTLAVKQKDKYAVYIANHLSYETEEDINVWNLVCKKFEGQPNLLSDLIHGGLFVFDDFTDAKNFFDFFNAKPIYGSGIYAEIYEPDGRLIAENT